MAELDLKGKQIESCVARARSVVIVLSSGTLESDQQLETIIVGMQTIVQIIPVLTPNFAFPSANYFENLLPRNPLLARQDFSIEQNAHDVQAFFKTIAITFSTSAGDSVLKAQSLQVVGRISQDVKKTQSAREVQVPYSTTAKSMAMPQSPTNGSNQGGKESAEWPYVSLPSVHQTLV